MPRKKILSYILNIFVRGFSVFGDFNKIFSVIIFHNVIFIKRRATKALFPNDLIEVCFISN